MEYFDPSKRRLGRGHSLVDLTAKRFGRWTVLAIHPERHRRRNSSYVLWLCRCDCGTRRLVRGSSLRRGKSTSCGCARRGKKIVDLTGKRFARWIVVALDPKRQRHGHGVFACWFCLCDCGTERTVTGSSLRRGVSKSCGCLRREMTIARNNKLKTKHGMCGTRAYHSWQAMLQRCFYPKNKWYSRYGGRGITVCARWLTFTNFLADMGEPPDGMSIDRINNANQHPRRKTAPIITCVVPAAHYYEEPPF
jgi:hypothetical protein